MQNFIVILNGTTLRDLPKGLNDFEETIELDDVIHGYVVKYDFTLTLVGDGFQQVLDLKREFGYNYKVPIVIQHFDGTIVNEINGYFYIVDCVFNHTKKTCEISILDNNYGAFIYASKDQRISPLAIKTKNGETLTPATAGSITLFTPSTGVNLGTGAKMFYIDDCLSVVVRYLSDNLIELDSNGQFNTTDLSVCALSKHYYMYNRGTDPDLVVSFADIMEFLFKVYGLWFKINTIDSPVKFTLIPFDDLFEPVGDIVFNAIRDLNESFNDYFYFSDVEVGDDNAIVDRSATYQLPSLPLIAFKPETYNAQGLGNTNLTLDLKSNFTIDHNRIEKMLTVATTEYDESVVAVQMGILIGRANKGLYGKATATYYNEYFLNCNVLGRHPKPLELGQQLGTTNNSAFKAYNSADSTVTASSGSTAVNFWNTDTIFGFDEGGNYNTANGRYVAPASGAFKFAVDLAFTINSLATSGFPTFDAKVRLEVVFTRYTTAGAVLETKFGIPVGDVEFMMQTDPSTPIYAHWEREFYMDATDYVTAVVNHTFIYTGSGSNSLTYKTAFYDADNNPKGCFFSTQFTFTGGGVAITPDFETMNSGLFSADDFPISNTDWRSLKRNPSQGLTINNGKNGGSANVWIKKISRNLLTGKSQMELISSFAKNTF